jgi:hypothetical protein
MNYTMELEGKLHDLSLQADKLSSQLHTLSKQEGKLRASKADLEQQVGTRQLLPRTACATTYAPTVVFSCHTSSLVW